MTHVSSRWNLAQFAMQAIKFHKEFLTFEETVVHTCCVQCIVFD